MDAAVATPDDPGEGAAAPGQPRPAATGWAGVRERLWLPFVQALEPADSQYFITRIAFLRALGAIYAVAFLALANQLLPLLGAGGLLPVHLYLDSLTAAADSGSGGFWSAPSLLWLGSSDSFMSVLAWLGFVLALALACGYASVLLLAVLWILYLSFVNVGQLFYGYGWEILTLEAGFLAIFLCPGRRGWGSLERNLPDKAVIWLLRWLLYRVMFGAGLIKLRGDPCWWDLTCLVHHYETQPLPSPLSWYLHQLPAWVHQGGVLFNHAVELVAPLMIFGPRRLRAAGGGLIALFQVLLILSGNLSWLNYLTLILCFTCFDDAHWCQVARGLPSRARAALIGWRQQLYELHGSSPRITGRRRLVRYTLLVLIGYLSIDPIANLVASRQVMNTSFDPLHLVNTYGAFGSVGKVRREVVLLGTQDQVISESTEWREYEFSCKPGDPMRRPCVIAPYQHRLDWQIWFAAMSDYRTQPWLVHLVYKLLHGNQAVAGLLEVNPFPSIPPRQIRAELYEYQFTEFGEEGWWKRRRVGEYLPALRADNPSLLRVIDSFRWPILDPPARGN